LVWHQNSDNMEAILNIFRGLAPLADAPEQEFEGTSTTSTLPLTSTTVDSSGPTANTEPTSTTIAGGNAPLSNPPKTAIVPDAAAEC